MKKLIKWFVLILLFVLLLAGAGSIYDAFNGNPVSAWLTQQKIESYLKARYPQKNYTFSKLRYNFKFHQYVTHVTFERETPFEIWAQPKGVDYDEFDAVDARDQELNERLSQQFETQLLADLGSFSPAISRVGIGFNFYKGAYPAGTDYSLGLEKGQPVSLGLTGKKLSRSEFALLCVQIQKAILAAGYEPDSLTFSYNLQTSPAVGKEGALLYQVEIQPAGQISSPAQIEPQIEEFNQGKL